MSKRSKSPLKILFVGTLLLFPTAGHGETILGLITKYCNKETAWEVIDKTVLNEKVQNGAVGTAAGFGSAVIADSIIREIIESFGDEENENKKSLPPTSLISILASSIYGSAFIDLNKELEAEVLKKDIAEQAIKAAIVSAVASAVHMMYRLTVEVSTTNKDKKFGFSKNFANCVKQFFLNFVAMVVSKAGSEVTRHVREGQG